MITLTNAPSPGPTNDRPLPILTFDQTGGSDDKHSLWIATAALVVAQVIGCSAADARRSDAPGGRRASLGETLPWICGYRIDRTLAYPALQGQNYTTIGTGGWTRWTPPGVRARVAAEIASTVRHPQFQSQNYIHARVEAQILGTVQHPRLQNQGVRSIAAGNYTRMQNQSRVSQVRGFQAGRR